MPSLKRRISSAMIALMIISVAVGIRMEGQTRGSQRRESGHTVGIQGQRGGVRSVTIPITIRQRGKGAVQQEITQIGELTVREDGEEQKILSIRAYGTETPISVAILIQDDVVSIGNEIKPLGEFIRRLPRGSRVMIGYITTGSLRIHQRFTADLDRAAETLRIPIGSSIAAPYNPYVEITAALKRFEALPKGRRALLVVSDGVDASRGVNSSSPSQSIDLDRAIIEAQRQGVAVYSFYAPSASATLNNFRLISNGQGSLERLAEETGGRAFFQGTSAPVSFDPYLKELAGTFIRQIALTYLSTHPQKGFHRIKVSSGREDIKIEHPTGYMR